VFTLTKSLALLRDSRDRVGKQTTIVGDDGESEWKSKDGEDYTKETALECFRSNVAVAYANILTVKKYLKFNGQK
jgi:hypothetical protein